MSKFDAAVIGAGIGGLTAAALLLGHNKKTVVIDECPDARTALGIVEQGGFIFSPYPSIGFGLAPGSPLREIVDSLGIPVRTSVPSPILQIALPDRRITVYPDMPSTLDELNREFPRETVQLGRFYRDVRKESINYAKSRISRFFARHRSARGFLRSYRFSRELALFFDLQANFFFRSSAAELPLERLVTMCTETPLMLHDGFRGLGLRMHELVLKRGGAVHFNERVQEYTMKGGRVTGIRTEHGIHETGKLLVSDFQDDTAQTFYFGIREEVVPEAMCPHVLFLDTYGAPGCVLQLSTAENQGEQCAPPAMRTLSASVRGAGPEEKSRDDVLERLNRIMPFVRDFNVLSAESGPRGSIQDKAKTLEKVGRLHEVHHVRSGLLVRGPKKNLYMIRDKTAYPHQVIETAHAFSRIAG